MAARDGRAGMVDDALVPGGDPCLVAAVAALFCSELVRLVANDDDRDEDEADSCQREN